MTEERVIKCLDKGFVELIDWMGDDKRIVDAARVSHQDGTTKVHDDRGLIRYLLRKLHTTPFEKIRFEFHVKLPILVARQWMRHRTGSFNEISARYSILSDDFYIPDELRTQSESNKQGSSEKIVEEILMGDPLNQSSMHPSDFLEEVCDEAYANYITLLDNGTARELARCVLPVHIYTEFYWTVDL